MSAMKTVFQGLMMSAAPEVDAVALRGGKRTVSIQEPLDDLMQSAYMEQIDLQQGKDNHDHEQGINPDEIDVEFDPKQDIVEQGLVEAKLPFTFNITGKGQFETITFQRDQIKTLKVESGFPRFEADVVRITTSDPMYQGTFYRYGTDPKVTRTGELFWTSSGGQQKIVCCGDKPSCRESQRNREASVQQGQDGPLCSKSREAIAVFNRMSFQPGKTKFSWIGAKTLLIEEELLPSVALNVDTPSIHPWVDYHVQPAEEEKVEQAKAVQTTADQIELD